MKELDDLDDLLVRNKYTYSVQVNRLANLLLDIKPTKGDFLYKDIIARVIWNAAATAHSISILIEANNDYGIKSLTRKVFECYLLLRYLLSAEEKEKVIAKIMAYDYLDLSFKNNKKDKKEVIKAVELIVYSYDESEKIITYFKNYINQNKKHWHWAETSYEKIIELTLEKIDHPEIDKLSLLREIGMLKSFHRNAHVDLDLQNNYLEDAENGEIRYKSPFITSKSILLGYVGLVRITIKDLINLTERNLKNNAT